MTQLECSHCHEENTWLTKWEAAIVREVSLGAISYWLDRGLPHIRMTDKNKTILIDKVDLLQYKPNRSGRPLGS